MVAAHLSLGYFPRRLAKSAEKGATIPAEAFVGSGHRRAKRLRALHWGG
jgi:hypothetical protein